MSRLQGRLGTLAAKDVMTRQLITVEETAKIADAIQSLKEHHVSGAPVIDDQGKLVGILSLADLVSPSPAGSDNQNQPPTALAHGYADFTTWDLFDRANPVDQETATETVGTRMSRSITSVTDDAPLIEVARAMCNGHWHRVPVVNSEGALCGIISTMDVLAAMVNAADESA